jgi:hypothetical protein
MPNRSSLDEEFRLTPESTTCSVLVIEHEDRHMTNEEIHIERAVREIAAVVVMRTREEMEMDYEAMLQEHRKQRAERCAKQRAW